MTPRSFDSFWVQNELDRARENGIPTFPLLLKGRQWLSVQTLQYVDVRDKSLPPEKFYKRLESVTPRNKPVPFSVKQEEKSAEQPKPRVVKPVEEKIPEPSHKNPPSLISVIVQYLRQLWSSGGLKN